MPKMYLHQHSAYNDLLRIVGDQLRILPALIEKDYWIMHVLYGLTKQGFVFELKGGTSLSKGYKIIDRFSEDIDIYIHPPSGRKVEENPKKEKAQDINSRREYFQWLTNEIKIEGITSIERDHLYDNETLTSAGIRLHYDTVTEPVPGLKPGILLEAGFATVTPNERLSIGSWALDRAMTTAPDEIIDNTATGIACYHPGYTLVEKLQNIVRKYRKEQETGEPNPNYMRQYYDVSRLLLRSDIKAFIGTAEYLKHKADQFRGKDKKIVLAENPAFLLPDPNQRENFSTRYAGTANLYYNGQPPFEELLTIIQKALPGL
ncbi:MAG TPA: nucleotidyl transferase AbiEii/AbiGii toxin family protein [Puia sp.]|nr:nucleotidyl transferase AbiEii/AbiGii toxin family protein [Puia sp.]